MTDGQLEQLKETWTSDPEDCAAGRAYGAALCSAGAYEEARRVLTMVTQHAGSAEELVASGRALEGLTAWPEASSAYARALDFDPLHADAQGLLAAVLLRTEGVEAAQSALRRWASLSPDPVQAHFQLAQLLESESLALAADHLQIALDLDPTHAPATSLLGIVLGKRGDREGSVAAWRAARALEPDSPQTASGLGVALSEAGVHEEAVALLEQAVHGANELTCFGRSLREIGQLARSVEMLEEAIKAEGDYVDAHVELGRAYLESDAIDEAVATLQRTVEAFPSSGHAHHQLGRALARIQRRAPALAALMKAASLLPHDPEVQSDLKALQDEMRGAKPADSSEMSGTLDVVTLPNLLEFFTNNAASGQLSITADDHEAQIFLDKGRISAARAPGVARLGDLLVEAGEVERVEVEAALVDTERATIGRLLHDRGLIDEDTLARRLDDQIVAALLQAAAWTGGVFQFRRGATFTSKEHCVHSLDTRFALMEVMRLLDEANAGRT